MKSETICFSGFVLAPKCLVSTKSKVKFMYREKPKNIADSGWRFFTGNETDEYVNNPENIGIYSVSTITEIDPDIYPYLNSPFGCAFEREEIEQSFVAVENFFSK